MVNSSYLTKHQLHFYTIFQKTDKLPLTKHLEEKKRLEAVEGLLKLQYYQPPSTSRDISLEDKLTEISNVTSTQTEEVLNDLSPLKKVYIKKGVQVNIV